MDRIQIIIDTRELALYNSIIDRDLDIHKDRVEISKDTLDLADIHIVYNDIHFVFERKTVADLISSIKDGRYKEQKMRLLSNIDSRNVSYIIEGDNVIASQSYTKNNNILLGSYYHMMYRDNIRLLFTKNISETTTFILTLAIKILENPSKFISANPESAIEYCNVLKMKKKKIDNIDTNTCYIMQLSQIPHISNTLAQNIAKIYPSMKELIYVIDKQNNLYDKIKLLSSIDKIGKEKANCILKYLSLE